MFAAVCLPELDPFLNTAAVCRLHLPRVLPGPPGRRASWPRRLRANSSQRDAGNEISCGAVCASPVAAFDRFVTSEC